MLPPPEEHAGVCLSVTVCRPAWLFPITALSSSVDGNPWRALNLCGIIFLAPYESMMLVAL